MERRGGGRGGGFRGGGGGGGGGWRPRGGGGGGGGFNRDGPREPRNDEEGFGGGPFRQGQSFDGKRMRKAIQRRTVDYYATMMRHLELLPPICYPHNSSTSVATKFVHTSINKIRCPVNVVRWTPEGRRLITGASSGEFTLWNGLYKPVVFFLKLIEIKKAHDKAIRSMVWSHNDTWLISGDDSGVIKYWQSNMNNLQAFQGHKESILTYDTRFASCSDDGTIKIWSFAEAREERTLTDWHPTKGLLASGSKDNLVKLWDPKTGKSLSTLHGHKNTILGIQWNNNGNWLVTASRDQLLRSFRGHKKEVTSVACIPSTKPFLLAGDSDGSVNFWNVG
ncbi:WD40-repeat-containing domain protein [Chytridium lagenaria]|nr:WD40-repeat-containing domain protein [Chytridium lagenaria]